MAREIRLALLQMRCTVDPHVNHRRACEMIDAAAEEGAQVICLPELYRSQYFCQTEDHDHFQLAEPVPGPSTESLSELAKRHHVVILASLFEKRAEGLYHNTSAVLDADGAYLGKYRKMHIPDDPLFYEKFYFTPGDLGFRTFTTHYGRIGTLVCWDQWFPEAARLTAMRGADLLVYPTAIGWHPAEKPEWGASQLESWQLIQRSHAVANGCYVASINRVGHEGADGGGIEFWGHSFVATPHGQMLVEGNDSDEQILHATIELDTVDAARTHWPFLRDRRIDAYSELTRRFLDDDTP